MFAGHISLQLVDLRMEHQANRFMGCDYNIEIMHWELKSGLGLGEHQVSGDKDRSEKSVGIAVLAYLFVLRVCHHEIVPGKPWRYHLKNPGLKAHALAGCHAGGKLA